MFSRVTASLTRFYKRPVLTALNTRTISRGEWKASEKEDEKKEKRRKEKRKRGRASLGARDFEWISATLRKLDREERTRAASVIDRRGAQYPTSRSNPPWRRGSGARWKVANIVGRWEERATRFGRSVALTRIVARDVTFVPVHDYYCAEYGPSNLWRQDLVARSLVGAVGRGTKWRRNGVGVAESMRWREISHRNRSGTVLGDENGSLVDWPAIIVDDFSKIKFLRTWLRNIVVYFVYFVSLLLYVLELCINIVWRVIEVKDESNIP